MRAPLADNGWALWPRTQPFLQMHLSGSHTAGPATLRQSLPQACDCSPGDGGNQEGLYRQFAATNCSCPLGTSFTVCPCQTVTIPSTAPQYCTSLQNGLFAPLNGTQPN